MLKSIELKAEVEAMITEAKALTVAEEITAKIEEIKAKKAQIVIAQMEEEEERLEVENKVGTGKIKEVKDVKDIKEVEDVRATNEYRDMFYDALKTGSVAEIKNVISVGSGNTVPVPTSFQNKLVEKLKEQNIMRMLGEVVSSDSDMDIPVEVAIGAAAWTDENGETTAVDDTFTKVTMKAYKCTKLVKVSKEALADNTIGLENYLVRNLAYSLGITEEEAMITGDGDAKPTGIVPSAGVGVTTASATAITADELIDLVYSLKRVYRKNAVFIMNDSTIKAIRKLKDSDGQYIWSAGFNGEPDMIFGRPVYTSEFAPSIASAALPIVFGDMGFYRIQTRGNLELQRLNELYAANGQVGFMGAERIDGKLTLAEAVKSLKMFTTI